MKGVKESFIGIRVSPDDKKIIHAAAKELRLTTSSFIRYAVFNYIKNKL